MSNILRAYKTFVPKWVTQSCKAELCYILQTGRGHGAWFGVAGEFHYCLSVHYMLCSLWDLLWELQRTKSQFKLWFFCWSSQCL